MSRVGSSRWSPTPEQVMILEQLYRSGIRTPTASQIQHITTHLCFYGRIEGKNVFYWFQNHKARDRQKLRRKLHKQLQLQQQQQQQTMLVQQQFHVVNQHDNIHHQFWPFGGGFDFSSSHGSSAQQIYFHNPSSRVSHQGEIGETSSETSKKKESEELDKTKTSSQLCNNYGIMSSCDRSFVDDVNEASLYGCTTSRPLRTLELFPTTSTKIKDTFSLTL